MATCVGLALTSSIPSTSAGRDLSSRQNTDILIRPRAIQSCAAPLNGLWYGSIMVRATADHYTSEPDETPIREIAVYHSRGQSRIYEIKVTWRSGRVATYGSRDSAAADAREDSLRLLEGEQLVLMQVETRETLGDLPYIIGLYFQTNRGRYTAEFGKPAGISYRPIGVGQDATGRKQHFLVTGSARAENSSNGEGYYGALRYINGFEVLARQSGGIQDIMPIWKDSETAFCRKIVDVRSDSFAGNNETNYRGHFSDAMLDVLTPERLDRVSLKSIKLVSSLTDDAIVGIQVRTRVSSCSPTTELSTASYNAPMLTGVRVHKKSTWRDGSETIAGPAHGDESVRYNFASNTIKRRSTVFDLQQNEVIVEIEYWHAPQLGLLSMRFIYNVYTLKGFSLAAAWKINVCVLNSPADGTYGSEQKLSDWHGNPDPERTPQAKKGIWTAPYPGKQGLVGFQGLLAPTPPLLASLPTTENRDKIAFDDMVALKPLWVQNPPIKAELTIIDVNHGDIIEDFRAGTTDTGLSVFIVNNPGPTCITQLLNWGATQRVGNTLRMSESSSITTGMSTSFSTTVGTSASAFGVSVHTESTLSFEAFVNVGVEQTSEKTWDTTEEVSSSQSLDIPAPPWSLFRATARTGVVKVEGSTWTGILTQTFIDMSTQLRPKHLLHPEYETDLSLTQEFNVSGSFSGTDAASILEVIIDYDVHPNAPEGYEPDVAACGARRSGVKITYNRVPGLAKQIQAEE
ncbi:hypothetical protein S40288_11601 [Stachybotrys chartarum IBT 40288]|nr:hypothetical protein S40288_11601 [Stachybotrys chartarum IBT 40288]